MSSSRATDEGRVLDFDGFPGRWEIRETDGDRFETRMVIEETADGSPFVHTHPHATETYEVIDGTLEVYVEGTWETVHAGERHTVPPGTAHTFRNTTPVELVNVHEPALGYESYFRRLHRLFVDQGARMPPEDLRSMVLVSMLTTEYDAEFRAVKPPQWLLRVLAGLGRLRRYELPD